MAMAILTLQSRKRNRDSRQQSVEDTSIEVTQNDIATFAQNGSDASRIRGVNASKHYVESHMTTEELERKVKDMVRLAVSHEYRRTPLRRDDIKERVLGDHSKAFAVILERAQITLKSVFGMELVEITKETKNQANRAWILRTVLDADLRLTDDIINWSRDEALMGITATILSLILVNNRVLNSNALAAYLRNLKMDDSFLAASRAAHAPISSGHIAYDHPDSLNAPNSNKLVADTQHILSYLVKHGYLDKSKAIEGAASDGQENFEYRWGPRARAEFPEKDMVGFIGEIMGSDGNNAQQDSEEATTPAQGSSRRTSRRTQRRTTNESDNDEEERTIPAVNTIPLIEHIAKAAGGPLES